MVTKLATTLPLAAAEAMIDGAFAEGLRLNLLPLTVVVLDAGGNLVGAKRQDVSGIVRFDVARGIGWASLGMGLPAAVLGQRMKENVGFLTGIVGVSGGRVAANDGGVLVVNEHGEAIGAVGISGDVGTKDEIAAIAGIRAAGYASLPG